METDVLYYVRNLLTFRQDLLPPTSTLKTEAADFPETSVYFCQVTRRQKLLPWEYRRFFFPMAQHPNCGAVRLTVEVSRSHTIRHTHTHTHTHTQPVGLLIKSDQPDTEAATYTTHNKHKRTYMHSTEFEPATPATERPHTYALDRL